MTLKTLLQGCVLWLEFREPNGSTVYDLSTQNNHGTIYGAQRTGSAYGRNLKFDGVDDHVQTPNITPDNKFTLQAVFKAPSGQPGWARLISVGINNNAINLGISSGPPGPDHPFVHFIDTDGQSRLLRSPTPFQTNVWHQLTGTYDGTTLSLFYDGKLVASMSPGVNVLTPSGPTRIGGRIGGVERLKGDINRCGIYNRALTPKEIQTRYQYPKWAPKLVVT